MLCMCRVMCVCVCRDTLLCICRQCVHARHIHYMGVFVHAFFLSLSTTPTHILLILFTPPHIHHTTHILVMLWDS